jgi:hypothetical protein
MTMEAQAFAEVGYKEPREVADKDMKEKDQ